MAGLALKNICKSFDNRQVLDNVSLELDDGELLVLLGPSGCGKSTLLRIIAGLEKEDSGEVYIAGKRVEHLRPRDRNIALVFQNYSLYPHMTVEKNLGFPLSVAHVAKNEIKQRVRAVATMLGLDERLQDRPGQLSGGQRQRVALGRAIIREPSIFLLDEPLSNLDADLRVKMRQEIVTLQKKLGTAMVHVTHDQTEALTMADRVALLHEGKLQQLGTPEELYRHPANRFVAEFIGQPKINIVNGRIDAGRVVPFGFEVGTDFPDSDIVMGIRPEAIELCGDGRFHATVISHEYMGDHYVIKMKFQDISLVTSRASLPVPDPGQEVRFDIPQKAIMFLRE
ncbi:MAG: ABC transporter ATP-binding protein [candidate division Zixibacteria bacterium]|nr:ABC transporter ATP-binding protein [candidate division Zixibacteria bacterium]